MAAKRDARGQLILKLPLLPKLTFQESDYSSPVLNAKYTQKEIRKEYTRLRSIITKRLKRFRGTEFENSETYEQYKEFFKTLKEIDAEKKERISVANYLAEAVHFLKLQDTSVTGQKEHRRKTLLKLHEHNYTFVNEDNFKSFYEFMQYQKSVTGGLRLASDQAADLFDYGQTSGLSPEQLKEAFKSWYNQEQSDKERTTMILEQGGAVEWAKKKFAQLKRSRGRGGRRKKK